MTDRVGSLLAILADAHWHSGADLAEQFGVTRATIANRVATLVDQGFDIHRVTGRGYRLVDGFDPLLAEHIIASTEKKVWQAVDVLPVVDSTNRWVSEKKQAHPRACFAERQTAGRGRRGKAWHSPAGGNLYCSASWEYAQTPEPLPALAPAIAVGLVQVLNQFVDGAEIKWPNDLWVDGKKLGGILIEHSGEFGGGSRLIIGIGLNVRLGNLGDIDQPATDIQHHLKPDIALPARNLLAAKMLDSIADVATQFGDGRWEELRQLWGQFDLLKDRPVTVSGGERLQGIACGMDSLGRLRIDTGSGIRAVSAGDISIRPQQERAE